MAFRGTCLHPLLWRQIPCHHISSWFQPLKAAIYWCVVAELASGLTRSSPVPRTLSPPSPPNALIPVFLATVLNLMLMQSERPLALFRLPSSAPSVFALQSSTAGLHLLSSRLWASLVFLLPLLLYCSCCWDAGLSADVAWQVMWSEVQCIIMLSENITMETSQSSAITLGSRFILLCTELLIWNLTLWQLERFHFFTNHHSGLLKKSSLKTYWQKNPSGFITTTVFLVVWFIFSCWAGVRLCIF